MTRIETPIAMTKKNKGGLIILLLLAPVPILFVVAAFIGSAKTAGLVMDTLTTLSKPRYFLWEGLVVACFWTSFRKKND